MATASTMNQALDQANQALSQAKRSVPGQFATAWGELRVGEGAILIAWQLLFSLFPLVIGILSILGLVLRDPERQAAIAESIAQQFPAQAEELVAFITETRDLGTIFGLISILGLLWSGSNLFGTMGIVFDRFYGTPERGFLGQRVVSFSMMAVYAVMIVISTGSASLTGILVGLSEELLGFEPPYFTFALGWFVALASAILMFLVLYRCIPNARIRIWNVWKGAVLSGILFVLLTQIFPLYLTYFGAGFAAFEALGVFLLLMTWFYFLSLILCSGAMLNAILSGHCPSPSQEAARETAKRSQASTKAGEDRESGGPVKVLVWAGLTATVTTLTLLLTRRLAAGVWRTITNQEPPR